jgi:hypothetical protein
MHRLLLPLALLAALALPAAAGAASGGEHPQTGGGGIGSESYESERGRNGTLFVLYEGRVRIKINRASAQVKRLVAGRRVIVSCDGARRVIFWPRDRDAASVRFASAEVGTTRKCAIRRLSGTPIDYANVLPSGGGPHGSIDF